MALPGDSPVHAAAAIAGKASALHRRRSGPLCAPADAEAASVVADPRLKVRTIRRRIGRCPAVPMRKRCSKRSMASW